MKQVETEQRFERREKRRKTNRTLNILIAIVFILIAIFAYNILTNFREAPTTSTQEEPQQPPEQPASDGDEDDEDDHVVKDENAVEETTSPVDERVIVPSDDSNVIEAFTNPAWEPIGTIQSEPHTTQFDSSSQDWKEMLMAITFATGLTGEDFTVWRIENGNRTGVGPSRSIGTIQTKDRQYRYRVTIEWVENGGWKPILVEQLRG